MRNLDRQSQKRQRREKAQKAQEKMEAIRQFAPTANPPKSGSVAGVDWLRSFRAGRGSFTGRIVFRHSVLAKRELFKPPSLLEYSENYYRARLVSPPWVQRAID